MRTNASICLIACVQVSVWSNSHWHKVDRVAAIKDCGDFLFNRLKKTRTIANALWKTNKNREYSSLRHSSMDRTLVYETRNYPFKPGWRNGKYSRKIWIWLALPYSNWQEVWLLIKCIPVKRYGGSSPPGRASHIQQIAIYVFLPISVVVSSIG